MLRLLTVCAWLLSFISIEAIERTIYLSARLSPEARKWNDFVTEQLLGDFAIFRPQDIDLRGAPKQQIDKCAYYEDLRGMEESDMLLLLPPYGRDCAWEVGWFCGMGRPAIIYAELPGDWLRDAMVKGGLYAIITSSPELYDILLEDPETSEKSYLIPSYQCLSEALLMIYNRFSTSCNDYR